MNRLSSFVRSSWPEGVLAVYLLTSFYKAATLWLPFDITIALLPVVIFASIVRLKEFGNLNVNTIIPIIFTFILFTASLYTRWTDYSIDKFARFSALTAPAILASPVIVRRYEHVISMSIYIVIIGLVLTMLSFVGYSGIEYRLETEGVSTISLGRGFGISAMICFGFALYGYHGVKIRIFYIILAMIFVFLILATGNRQGLVALIVSIVVLSVMSSWRKTFYLVLPIIGMCFIVITLLWNDLISLLPEYSILRYKLLVQGFADASSRSRLEMFNIAWNDIGIIGKGWGSFANLGLRGHGEMLGYPHNIFIEIWYEHGIIPTFIMFVILLLGIWRVARDFRISKSLGVALMAGMLAFVMITSSVSGDIYSNKYELSIFMIACCVTRNRLDRDGDR